MKSFYVLLPICLIFLGLLIFNSQISFSQSSEDPKSLNCKDNKDQSKYVSNTSFSGDAGPVVDDLQGFHYVKKFDSNGSLISAWGTKGTGPGHFLHAHGIAVDSKGNVYVSDAEKCNIQKFDSDGKFITMWGSRGTGPSQFFQPESIAVDSNGNVFVTDYANQYIQKFDSDGKFITMWGSKGRENGQFIKPWGIAIDSRDNVYTSDQDNPEVQKFDNEGKFISKWNSYSPGLSFVHLHGITIDENDNVYVTDGRNNSRVAKFDVQGNFIKQWGSYGSGNGRFIEDHGIATDNDGHVYVVDTRNVRIQKFSSEGEFITKWGTLGCRDDQFLIPHDIAIDNSGNIYVTDSGNVHFLAEETCKSFEGKNWTSTIRKILSSKMSGEAQVPPVETNLTGTISIIVPQSEDKIEYKINIFGTTDISSAYIHTGNSEEDDEAVADLLNGSKKNHMKSQTGLIIRGEILESELTGSMEDKTMKNLIFEMTDGMTYVNVSTPTYGKGEIRGQIQVADNSLGN